LLLTVAPAANIDRYLALAPGLWQSCCCCALTPAADMEQKAAAVGGTDEHSTVP